MDLGTLTVVVLTFILLLYTRGLYKFAQATFIREYGYPESYYCRRSRVIAVGLLAAICTALVMPYAGDGSSHPGIPQVDYGAVQLSPFDADQRFDAMGQIETAPDFEPPPHNWN